MWTKLGWLLFVGCGIGFADYLDITKSLSDAGKFGPVTFRGDYTQPVGTGVFEPFWRAQQHGNDKQYEFFNTNARPLSGDLDAGNNANGGDIKNRTFPVNSLLDVGGYYVFLLDINEPNSSTKAKLSMDKFILRTSPNDQLSTFNALSMATLIYNIDGAYACSASAAGGSQAKCVSNSSNGVLLTEKLNPGSGKTNLAALVPSSLFAGHTNEYLYLDVHFGGITGSETDMIEGAAEAGFEEWSALRDPSPVPEPSSVALALTVAVPAAALLRRTARRARS